MYADEERKVLYLKLNKHLFSRMKMREIKRYLMHELLHGFFGELSIFFESVIKNAGFSERKRKALINGFDGLEHKKINYFINLMFALERSGKAVK